MVEEEINFVAENKKEDNSKVLIKKEKEEKEGPRVLSRIHLIDNDYEIKENEIKRLPSNWKERKGLKFYVDAGRFEFLEKQDVVEKKVKKEGEEKVYATLDEKDVINFLSQNSKTVLKRLNINDLPLTDLENLLDSEKFGKRRTIITKELKLLIKRIKR